MRCVAVVQARMGSSRLAGKSLLPLGGRPLLVRVLERVRGVEGVDDVVLATTDLPADDLLAENARRNAFGVYRGSAEDVLSRYVGAAEAADADVVLRVTGDNPFVDRALLADEVHAMHRLGVDYVAARGFPVGVFGEVVSTEALRRAVATTTDPVDREHVTMHLKRHPGAFCAHWIEAPPDLRAPDVRVTIDERADYEMACALWERLPPGFTTRDVLAMLRGDPALAGVNAHVRQAVPFEPEVAR